MLPIAYALEECTPEVQPKDIPCRITSTWNYTPPCTTHKMIVLNDSAINIVNYTFSSYGGGLCNVTWNITTAGSYNYYLNTSADTGSIIVRPEDDMASLTIGLFLMSLVVGLFLLPFFVRFTEKESTNQLIKKMMWIMAFAFLAFITSIFTTLADNAGLGITPQMLTFLWLFHKSLFIFMILLFFNIITSIPKLWKAEKIKKRMGEYEG